MNGMNDEELQKLDAQMGERVMGWKMTDTIRRHGRQWMARACRWRVNNNDSEPEAWRPSTDIRHAWDVIDHLRETRIASEFTITRSKDIWSCGIDLCQSDVSNFAVADTAPLAICLAALKAMGHPA